MSVHLARAEVLLAQSRPADAEREALHALAQDPQDAEAHAFLALCRVRQDRAAEALEEAERAVSLAPDIASFHRILGVVHHRLGRSKDALAAVETALRIDPNDADSHVVRAVVHLNLRQWKLALAATEAALAIDPEHVEAANFRAMALVQLGRKEEATLTVDYALHREPGNALSHANQGWNRLHHNDPRAAKTHFREALRLDPTLEFAREGMLEALKARNPVYRVMLAYYLWIGRQSSGLQALLIIGVFAGGRLLRAAGDASPALDALFFPLLIVLYGFVYLTWTAQPLFNLMLRLDPFGRHVLSRDQRQGSTVFGLVFAAMLVSFVTWQITDSEMGLLTTVQLAVISLCVAATWSRRGRNRLILGAATIVLTVLAAVTTLLFQRENPDGQLTNLIFIGGFICFQVAALSLRGR